MTFSCPNCRDSIPIVSFRMETSELHCPVCGGDHPISRWVLPKETEEQYVSIQNLPLPESWNRWRRRRNLATISFVLAVFTISALLLYFSKGKNRKLVLDQKPADLKIVHWLPKSTKLLIGFDIQSLREVDQWDRMAKGMLGRKILDPIQPILHQWNLNVIDLNRIVVASSQAELLQDWNQSTVVVQAAAPIFSDRQLRQLGYRHLVGKQGSHFRDEENRCLLIANEQTILVTAPERLDEALETSPQRGKLVDPLLNLVERGGGFPYWIATTEPSMVKDLLSVSRIAFHSLGDRQPTDFDGLIQSATGIGLFYSPTKTEMRLLIAIVNENQQQINWIEQTGNRELSRFQQQPKPIRDQLASRMKDPDLLQIVVDILESGNFVSAPNRLELTISMNLKSLQNLETKRLKRAIEER